MTSQIISKGFTGRHGRAFLVQGTTSHITSTTNSAQLPNTYQNKAVPRNLVTGQHTVSDISCSICGSVLGWKYVEASEESQKYKVGKFILETKKIRVGVNWENGSDDDLAMPPNEIGGAGGAEAEMEFDSQDEDECEDLFAGVWSPQLAAKRRERKSLRFGGRGRNGNVRAQGIRARSEETLS
jgi:Yippee zinc-binding/DNA-binding /Mis18, centromere assembly